ncbi:MAG: hypothetical protein HND47_24270 [Chloroflexi bacterium]|nr:hypothetical protein [Chloroflexota bacterium]
MPLLLLVEITGLQQVAHPQGDLRHIQRLGEEVARAARRARSLASGAMSAVRTRMGR